MFRLLLVLLCGISTYSGFPQWLHTRVEVTVMSESPPLEDYEVEELFYDYGKRHFPSSNMYVHRLKNCNETEKSPARFEGYVTNCNDFQTYLLHFGKWLWNDYYWKMIHVKCNGLHFSLCLHSCSPQNYTNLANCAYNTAV